MARDPKPKPPRGDSESAWEAYDRELNAWEERRSRRRLGLASDTALAATSLVGLATNPAQPPSTDQLNDAHTTQVNGYEQSIEEAGRDQGTDTSQGW
jgi:hypothetical protein